jgi:hypothetical protein
MVARTWLGGGDNLASDPNDWSPMSVPGIPQPGDTLSMDGGTMNVVGDVLIGDTLGFIIGPDNIQNTINVSGASDFSLFLGVRSGTPANVNLAADSVWTGSITNEGGSATVEGPGSFANVASSNVSSSRTTIDAPVIGTGTFTTIGPLEFGAAVGAGQTVIDQNSPITGNGTVKIDDPADFHATVMLGFAGLALEGIQADSYTYANNVLSLWSGAAVVDTLNLTLTGQDNGLAGMEERPGGILGVSQVAGGIAVDATGTPSDGMVLGVHQTPAAPVTPPAPASPTPPVSTLPPASPAPTPTPPAATPGQPVTPAAQGFAITDTTTGEASSQAGTPYSGPVAGLTSQIILTSPDNLNITASVPNSFIHTGAGNDAISVSSGNNVLDGSTGSNFLTGGSGADTFFVDDRGSGADIWSTVVGFHAGDTATIWGVTQAGFTINWLDGQGTAGFKGLTAGFTAAGKPNANITFAGYSSADLAPGGRLSVTFGTTADQPGAPGSAFMMVSGA